MIQDELRNLDVDLNEVLNIVDISDENDRMSKINASLDRYTLENISRDSSGRLVVPLWWNSTNSHLLAKNFYLSKQLLKSTYQKLAKEPLKLEMYGGVFKEQIEIGIIEEIPDLKNFIESNPKISFMPHMGVFRLTHSSTKTRVVFLANLAERQNGEGLSLNQVILPGPCLNQKMSTAVTLVRFDKFLITYDLVKVFLMCGLKFEDSNRLCFLRYRDIAAGDFSLIGYRTLRLPFGLRPSPTSLMLCLYKILMLDQTGNSYCNSIKPALWNSIYIWITVHIPQMILKICNAPTLLYQKYSNLINLNCSNFFLIVKIYRWR